MNDRNDAALSALLRQNRSSIPSPTVAFKDRVIRAYERRVPARGSWRQLFSRTLPLPAPIAALAAATLLLIGFAVGSQMRLSANRGGRDGLGRWAEDSSPANRVANGEASPSLGGLQVVAELRPRIVGGLNENR